MSKPHHLHPALATLYAKHPSKAVTESLNSAYELGLGNLKAVLDQTSRRKPAAPAGPATRINDFPTPFVHILNGAILARTLLLLLPHYFEAVTRDERRIVGGIEGQLRQFLTNTLRTLSGYGAFRPTDTETPQQVADQYIENLADLTYECLHEMNNNADPRAPHAAMRMYNELNMVEALPDTATDTL